MSIRDALRNLLATGTVDIRMGWKSGATTSEGRGNRMAEHVILIREEREVRKADG